MRKIRTEKYVIYADTGQIYFKDGLKYFRTLTDSQYDYVKDRKWNTKVKQSNLERLIDGGDEAFELEASKPIEGLELSFAKPTAEETCYHKWRLLDLKDEGNEARFYCTHCLEIRYLHI